jgi:hypothetical protein
VKGKIIDETPDEGPGHFAIIQFKVPQIFNENRADDDIAGVQDDQKLLQAVWVAFVKKQPN